MRQNYCEDAEDGRGWGQGVQGAVGAKMAGDQEKGGRKEAVKLLSTASSTTSR